MGTARQNTAGAVIALAVIGGVVALGPQPVGDAEGGVAEPNEIGARGWQTDPSFGRTTGSSAPASGLSRHGTEVLGRHIERARASEPGPESAVDEVALSGSTVEDPPTGPVGLAASPPVSAPTPADGETSADPPPSELTARGADALALLGYDWKGRLASWSIVFEPAEDGVRGLTFSAERRIEIYVRDGDTAWDIARVTAHELGHAVDLEHHSREDRDRWREQRSLDEGTSWWPVSGASDFATGAGDFAECFATWQVGSTSLSRVAGACSPADLELVANLS